MERCKLVLSGPITGVPDYKERFAYVASVMRKHFEEVFSPAELEDGHDEGWYMSRCLEHISTCGHVFFMSGWEHSAGCRAEWSYAVKIGVKTSYQDCMRNAREE